MRFLAVIDSDLNCFAYGHDALFRAGSACGSAKAGAFSRKLSKTCRREGHLHGNPKNMLQTSTSARKSKETCRRRLPLQANSKKLAEDDAFCTKMTKALQRTMTSARNPQE